MTNKKRSTFSKVPETIKNQDIFGQSINLNYKGNDFYKSFPGGILSIFCLTVSFAYFMMKLKQMVLREDWKLVT